MRDYILPGRARPGRTLGQTGLGLVGFVGSDTGLELGLEAAVISTC